MRRRGFTLIELMVVIGITALLATIVLPVANRAYAHARRVALAADLQAVANAIDAYKHDFGDIPRPNKFVGGPFQGSVILCWTLLAPGPSVYAGNSPNKFTGDGADGYGFRIRGQTGTILGPYLAQSTFRIGLLTDTTHPIRVAPTGDGIYDDSATFLGDREGNAILYFPRKTKITITSINNYLGTLANKPAFAANDNDPGLAVATPDHPYSSLNTWAIQQFQLRLPGVIPDASGNPTLPDPNQATKLPYLLWDAGPDGQFCSDDDVTNFN